MAFATTSGGRKTADTETASAGIVYASQITTFDAILVNKTPYFRRFWQGQGTAVQGTWAWTTSSSQTNFASIKGEAAGYFYSSNYANLDEYKWSNIFLTKGTYKITIITLKALNRGILEVLFGTTSLGTKDCYAGTTAYNELWEITFTLTADQTADLRFRANGKNASSSGYNAEFSRFQIEKTG